MYASNLLLNAYVSDEFALGRDEQRLIGLINSMTLFAPSEVIRVGVLGGPKLLYGQGQTRSSWYWRN